MDYSDCKKALVLENDTATNRKRKGGKVAYTNGYRIIKEKTQTGKRSRLQKAGTEGKTMFQPVIWQSVFMYLSELYNGIWSVFLQSAYLFIQKGENMGDILFYQPTKIMQSWKRRADKRYFGILA